MTPALPHHPLAVLFPLLDGDEFDALVADIRAYGLRQRIVLYNGAILDGRNRYRACTETGIEPRFEVFNGADPLAFVVSLNLARRHLSESQRAIVAAKIATLKDGQRSDLVQGLPIGRAAEMLNVGERSVARAKAVLEEGVPELIEKVERGEVSVSAAAELSRFPVPEQREIVAAGSKAVVEAARAFRTFGMAAPNNNGCNEWYTPATHIELVRRVLGEIDLDPASHPFAQQTVQAAQFFTQEDDGLARPWGGRIFCNPPYSKGLITPFVDKLLAEIASGNVREAILLTHNHSDTRWFQAAVGLARRVCLTAGRLGFYGSNGEIASPVQGQAFHYFGENVEKFEAVFSAIGAVLEPKAGAGALKAAP
jgi:DNA N-6-adenine-methyltransferase (Dam)